MTKKRDTTGDLLMFTLRVSSRELTLIKAALENSRFTHLDKRDEYKKVGDKETEGYFQRKADELADMIGEMNG